MRIIANLTATMMTTVLIVLLIPGCRTIEDRGVYVRADVYSISWATEHIVAATPYAIARRSSAERAVIDDQLRLGQLRERINDARLLRRNDYVDTRMTVVVWFMGGAQDTIGFGRGGMTINEDVYAMDTVALKIVASYLSAWHQENVESEALDLYRRGYKDR